MKAADENLRCLVSTPNSESREPQAGDGAHPCIMWWLRVASSAPAPPCHPTSSHWRSWGGAGPQGQSLSGEEGVCGAGEITPVGMCLKNFLAFSVPSCGVGCLKHFLALGQR